jgi:hypothetical protein
MRCVKHNDRHFFSDRNMLLRTWYAVRWTWTQMFVRSAEVFISFRESRFITVVTKPHYWIRGANKLGIFLPLLTLRRNLKQLRKSCSLKLLRQWKNSDRIITGLSKQNTDNNIAHLKYILILSFHPRLGLLNWLFPWDIRSKMPSLLCASLLVWEQSGWCVVLILQILFLPVSQTA